MSYSLRATTFAAALAAGSVAAWSPPAQAQELLERYTARLSEADHFSSKGARLGTAAGILRQDRANFHRFGVRDSEDSGDEFFSDAKNRDLMERLLLAGRISGSARDAIVNGTPTVTVSIYRIHGVKDYVQVEVYR